MHELHEWLGPTIAVSRPGAHHADASVTEDVEVDRIRVFAHATPPAGLRGVTVRTRLGGAGVDVRFQLRVY